MSRYVERLENGETIEYGYEHAGLGPNGYFAQRFEPGEGIPQEGYDTREMMCLKNEEQANRSEIAEFLKKYSPPVPEAHIKAIAMDKPF